MSGPAILEVKGLHKSFGGVQAIRDCSFEVAEGSITGLIGPNGAGKSTALDLVSGFLRADSGSIRFAGQSISGLPAHAIAAKGLVRTFQSTREWGALTVLENLLVAAAPKGRDSIWAALTHPRRLAAGEAADRERGRRILADLELIRLHDEQAANLSGGQKRLLEFARIMMAEPRMVLLDEPLAGVNPVLAPRILTAIQGMQRAGITVLIIEHNLHFLEQVCERTIVMALGSVIAVDTMARLRANEAVLDAYLGASPVV